MSKTVSFKNIWHSAGIAGIVLAAVSIAYFLFSSNFSAEGAVWRKLVAMLVDIAKIVACIWLLRYYLKTFANEYPDATTSDVRRLGAVIAALSALVFSAAVMAYYIWNPEIIETTFQQTLALMKGKLDANSLNSLESVQNNFPTIAFVSQFIYCFVFGWLLTLILAPRVRNSNPFANDQEEEEEEL